MQLDVATLVESREEGDEDAVDDRGDKRLPHLAPQRGSRPRELSIGGRFETPLEESNAVGDRVVADGHQEGRGCVEAHVLRPTPTARNLGIAGD